MNDAATGAEIVRFSHVSKQYPGTLANDDVSLTIRRGEVFALVGENGAGKSTLMNLLYGLQAPTLGEIYIKGKPTGPQHGPENAMRMGVSMVHQHFKLVPSFTVAHNVMLGHEPRRGLFYDGHEAEETVRRLSAEYGLKVEPGDVVRDLSVGIQQRVEILKALRTGADVLILDEPTAVLTPQEAEELFQVIRRVVEEKNMTVILITHRLPEVMRVSDRVGVMRKGRLIGVENTCDVDEKKLASMMVGRPVLYDRLEKTGEAGAEQIAVHDLTVCDDRGLVAVDGLSLSVRAGEVLGIAAIEGNGQSELLEAITGMRRVERGTVEVCGQNVTGKTAGEIRKVGLSHIPEDRLATGVSRSASVTDNLLMGKQRDKAFSGFAFHQRHSSIERYAEEVYQRFDIRGAGIDTAVGSMSGGNMQKVVVAREFSFDSPVLIIAQPTRGVDVGAIEFIHTRIIEKRNAGCAILLCSADLDEVFRLSDRIITMYEGRITGEFRTSDITKEEIGWYMTGHREGKEAAKT